VGGIISLWWAASFRYGGRHHLVMMGGLDRNQQMSAKDKKEALDDLNQAAKAPEPTIENKGNIDLVVKNFDKLAAIIGDDQN
jgi:hypothetical protein